MYYFCLGIRTNDVLQERVCENREYCPYYRNVNLRTALMHPDEYVELETYDNDLQCIYFDKEWMKTKICATSDAQTDGLMTLLKTASSK